MFTHLTDAQVKRELKLYKNQKHFYLQTKVFIMNKKYLSALLIGAITVASTSTFVSCKDYDDDIDELHALVDQNSSALQAAKAALEGEIASLKTQLEAKDAELASLIQAANAATAENKEAIAKEVLRAIEAEAALEARIVTAEKAIADIQAVLANKVNKDEFESTVKDIYAKLETVTNGLGEAMKSIEGLQKGLEDEETARKAVAADLAQQVAALEALTKRVAAIEGDYLKAADKKALEDKIKEVSDALKAEAEKVATNAASIEALKKTAESLSNMVDELSAELNTLNVFVKGTLRSIVFIPDSYYWGIEATSIKYLAYDIYTLEAANVDKKLSGNQGQFSGGWVNDLSKATKVRPQHTPTASSKAGYEILNFVANYHLNPSNADLKDASYTILSDDKQYINTRAAEAGLSFDGVKSIKNGILSVNIKAANPSKIKSVPANEKVTVFATQITLNNSGKEDTTITSDYATLYADHIKDIVIAHKQHPMTKVTNDHCGECNLTPSNKATKHLFATAEEAAINEPQDTCDWNKELDLRTLVVTHYTEVNGDHKELKIEDHGLSYKFELVGLWFGSNVTSESAHAAINPENGYTFRPQAVLTSADGKHQAPYGSEQTRSSIDRTPLVRVSLMKDNQVIDYGYIRIRISETVIPAEEKPAVYVSYTGASYQDELKFDENCLINFKSWSFKQRWDEMENDVYRMVAPMGLSKAEFDANYSVELDDNGAYQQYNGKRTGKTDENGKEIVKFDKLDLNKYRGSVTQNINTGAAETNVVLWDINGGKISSSNVNGVIAKNTFWNAFNPWAKLDSVNTDKIQNVAIKFLSKDEYTYPSVFVWMETGAIDLKFKFPYGYTLWDNNKIKEYWYKKGSASNEELAEVRTNTDSPEDEQCANLSGRDFENTFADLFVKNMVVSSSHVKLASPYTANSYFNKSEWALVFSKNNDGKKFNGIDENQKKNSYTLYVGANTEDVVSTINKEGLAKSLYARLNNTGEYQRVAYLDYDANAAVQDVNSTVIKYTKTAYAKALLNYKSHLAISDAKECEDVLNIIIALDGKLCETDINMNKNEFDVRFLRPINVKDSQTAVTDAATDTLQFINIRDLVELSDWRSTESERVWKDGKNGEIDYWNYYQIKSITVVGATASQPNISDKVYTNLNRGFEADIIAGQAAHRLSNVSKNVQLTYIPATNDNVCDFDENDPANYGQIVYKNLSSTVDKFKILIPLKVEYEWGYVFCNVTLNVNRTAGNAKPRN